MNGKSILSHQDRLEIVFRLKLELLRDVLLGRYRVNPSDFKKLILDLKEILHISEAIEYGRYLR